MTFSPWQNLRTAKGRREKKRYEGGGGKRREKRGQKQRDMKRERMRVSRNKYGTIVPILFPTCRSTLHQRALYPRVYQATGNYDKSSSSAIFQGD